MAGVAWTADLMMQNPPPPGMRPPTDDELTRIIDELYDEWVPANVDASNLLAWGCARFGANVDDIGRDDLHDGSKRRIDQIKNLFMFVKANASLLEDGKTRERVERIAKVVRETRNSVQAVAILSYQLDDNRALGIPSQWNPDSYFQFADDEKLTNFQKLLMAVLRRLSADELRRIEDACYEQVVIHGTGERSHAWQRVCSIKEYIYSKIQKETDYEEWKCLTNPHDNGEKVAKHLMESMQIEFPTIDINRFLWAFNNGLYNVKEDMFWPWRAPRLSFVNDVTAQRVRVLPVHEIGEDDDALDESTADEVRDGVCVWNILEDGALTADTCFKLDDNYYSNFMGRESWPTLAQRITAYRRGVHFATLDAVDATALCALRPIDTNPPTSEPDAVTINGVHVWNVEGETLTRKTLFGYANAHYSNALEGTMQFHDPSALTAKRIQQKLSPCAVSDDGLRAAEAVSVCHNVLAWNVDEDGAFTANTVFAVSDGLTTPKYYKNGLPTRIWKGDGAKPYVAHVPTADDVAVKHFDCDFRFEITPEAEAVFENDLIDTPEITRIMTTQDLDDDSQMWLLIMLCRLFFPTSYDAWQVVLFIKGIAGSGKSTLAQIIRSFYPPEKISTLTSNIENKFGLSGVYKGLICICSEVREDFGLDQGDWQSAVSGEEVQIAEKGKTAFPHKWHAPFFFLGNELPNYRNNSGSVDRRFFMIEFRHRVKDSDPKLFEKFSANIDRFMRKGVSLYHEVLHKYGDKDIWAGGVLGPQIHAWRDAVKKSTDALHAFLTAGYFDVANNLAMPLDNFKQAYTDYRKENGFDKVKWTREHYDAVFQDMGLYVKKDKRDYDGTTRTGNFIFGVDFKNDDDGMVMAE